CNRQKESLVVMLEEVDIIARNELEKMLFGENYPYGWSAKPEDYDKLKLEWIKEYYEKNINASNLKIFVTSNDESNSIKILNQHFADLQSKTLIESSNNYQIQAGDKERIIEKPKALQSAIRVAWQLFDRKHENYIDFTMLSALLGGYFGSRLMQNIRQKKGYTYSIYSSVSTYKYDGFFEIVSEVNKENKNKVFNEIIKEVEFLRNNFPSEEELQKMKSYMSGSVLRSLDGVFSYSRSMVTFVTYNMKFDYYQHYFKKLKSITPQRITELAQKYLNPDECYKVIVG
ncbi:MAG: pitrilysin family protein, partial [Bacteroidota bacterium]|nr:pitrilysin family protein [Bacteroidota bacterium]